MKLFILFLAFLFLFIGKIFSQDSLRFLSATTGAACYQVEYYNNYIFAGTGSTLRVYDVNGNPPYNLLFEYRFKSIVLDLEVRNNFLYVAANHDGISKWDISNMNNLQKLYEYIPDSLNEAAYDIAFFGDTLFVAYFKKVGVFYDNGTSFQKISTFGHITGNGFIAGGDIKDSIYAYTVGRNTYSGATPDGVYFRNAKNLTFISSYPQTFAAPEDVIFGKNNSLLHVLGGSQYSYNPMDSRGLFYSLDISNINSPQLVFSDTLWGFCFLTLCPAVGGALNAVNQNDTIYVATNSALDLNNPTNGQVFVYDATNSSNVHFVTYLNAGLWHFDVDINQNKLYIASEWYGIKTLDITDLFNEVDLGNTLTGGWAMKGDKFGNSMVLANEGYGFKKFDITNPSLPVLSGAVNTDGFCQDIKFSPDGNYIYVLYQSYNQFRIYDAATLTQVGFVPTLGTVGYGKSDLVVWNNIVYIDKNVGGADSLIIIDVSNPTSPFLNTSIPITVNDMKLDNTGKLFVCNNDGVYVYDITSGTPVLLDDLLFSSGLQDGKQLAVLNDTIYVFVTWKGLVRYIFNSNTINEDITVQTGTLGTPQAMAADSFGLYMAFTKFGLYAYNKQTLSQKSWYRTGLDLKGFTDVWPVTDLYCKDNLIFLNEYFGQTTILTMDNNYSTNIKNNIFAPNEPETYIFPNPASDKVSIEIINDKQQIKNCELTIFDMFGNIVYFSKVLNPKSVVLNINLPNGIYFLQVRNNNFMQTKKLEVIK